MELTLKQVLHKGVTAHKEGRLQDAERHYRAILRSQPFHPDANHNLGVLAVSMNQVQPYIFQSFLNQLRHMKLIRVGLISFC